MYGLNEKQPPAGPARAAMEHTRLAAITGKIGISLSIASVITIITAKHKYALLRSAGT